MKEFPACLYESVPHKPDMNQGAFDGFAPVFISDAGMFAHGVYYVLRNIGFPMYGFFDHIEREILFLYDMSVCVPENASEVTGGDRAVVFRSLHHCDATKLLWRGNNARL